MSSKQSHSRTGQSLASNSTPHDSPVRASSHAPSSAHSSRDTGRPASSVTSSQAGHSTRDNSPSSHRSESTVRDSRSGSISSSTQPPRYSQSPGASHPAQSSDRTYESESQRPVVRKESTLRQVATAGQSVYPSVSAHPASSKTVTRGSEATNSPGKAPVSNSKYPSTSAHPVSSTSSNINGHPGRTGLSRSRVPDASKYPSTSAYPASSTSTSKTVTRGGEAAAPSKYPSVAAHPAESTSKVSASKTPAVAQSKYPSVSAHSAGSTSKASSSKTPASKAPASKTEFLRAESKAPEMAAETITPVDRVMVEAQGLKYDKKDSEVKYMLESDNQGGYRQVKTRVFKNPVFARVLDEARRE